MKKFVRPLIQMNNFKLRMKFFFLYFFCVLIPIILLASLIVFVLSQGEIKEQEKERKHIAERLANDMESLFVECETAADSIYTDSELSRFLSDTYTTTNDYYDAYLSLQKVSGLNYIAKTNAIQQITVFADNPGILNGGYFYQLSYAKEQDWYLENQTKMNNLVLWRTAALESEKNSEQESFYILRRMDYFEAEPTCYLCITIEKNEIYETLENGASDFLLYLYDAQENLIYTTNKNELTRTGASATTTPTELDQNWNGRISQISIKAVDTVWYAYVIDPSDTMWGKLYKSNTNIVLLLIVLISIPTLITLAIERSIIQRIEMLKGRFDAIQNKPELLAPIPGDYGKDEIGSLIRHFNSMLLRITDLIDTITAKTVEKNQLELLKTRAELDALQSQVNPHFIYNTLESICMRSMLKGETETANIVREMSRLLREMSRWSHEDIFLHEEISFVEAYLRLQKYRFGDRLEFEINLDKDVLNLKIPKLTVISFVENACVYGFEESLTDVLISVTAIKTAHGVEIAVTDNGAGIEAEKLQIIRDNITHADISRMEQGKSTGILNAYLRLRMRFGEDLTLTIDSVPDKSTCVKVYIKDAV